MTKVCYVCGFRQKAGDYSVAFHKFPKDVSTRSSWFRFCKLTEGIDNVSNIYVCSLHFTPDDFKDCKISVTGAKFRSLKTGAIPTKHVSSISQRLKVIRHTSVTSGDKIEVSPIKKTTDTTAENVTDIPFKPLLQPESDTLVSIIKSEDMDTVEFVTTAPPPPCAENFSTIRKRKFVERRFVSEIRSTHVGTPKIARRLLALVHRSNKEKSKKIKSLQDQIRYLQNRISNLKQLLDHLISRGNASPKYRRVGFKES